MGGTKHYGPDMDYILLGLFSAFELVDLKLRNNKKRGKVISGIFGIDPLWTEHIRG